MRPILEFDSRTSRWSNRIQNPISLWRLVGAFFVAGLTVGTWILASANGQNDAKKVVPWDIVPKSYVCFPTRTPMVIDGKLDDRAWQDAPWTSDFVDIEGDAKPRPRFRTRAKMLWDKDFFYVAAEMDEPHVWGSLTEHDSVIFHDNDFEVFIDPNGDNHGYYEFEMNALNTGWDLLLPLPYKDGGQAMNSWEIPGLKTGVFVDGTLNNPQDRDRGWSVEMAFPWKVLKELAKPAEPPKDGDQWRVNFSRVEWQHEVKAGKYQKVAGTSEDNWVWSPQGVINMHRPETWGYVQFSNASPSTANLRADPAMAARQFLHRVYYAQVDFVMQRDRYARAFDQLGVPTDGLHATLSDPMIETTSNSFEATVKVRYPDGKVVPWHIRQDSLIWPK